MRAFRERFGVHCIAGYGSSENAIIMVPVPGMPKDALGVPQDGHRRRRSSIPRPARSEHEPRFDDDGKLLNGADAIGEIVGRNVVDRFEGYYNNPEADAERTRNGWYWSGDLGYRDDADVFYFAGRTGDWLRVDGENFATAPVERILERVPGVDGVAVYAGARRAHRRRPGDGRHRDGRVASSSTRTRSAGFSRSNPISARSGRPGTFGSSALPVGATNKVDKRPLRADRWYTDDPLYWRPTAELTYRRFDADDLAALEARFREHGRADAIGRP